MRFASAISGAPDADAITQELLDGVRNVLPGPCHLAALFFTGPLTEAAAGIASQLRVELGAEALVGVSCESIIGCDQEIETRPAASLLVGHLPGVQLRPFHIGREEWSGLLGDDERMQQRIGTGDDHRGQLIIGDPFSTPVDELLETLDRTLKVSTFGGMASAARQPGGNVLILNDQAYDSGCIGIGFGGEVRIDTVVSQGCRPIGEPMVVTRSEQNVVFELGRRPALEAAQTMLQRLSDSEKEMLRGGLLLGVVINEYQDRFNRGDFLVRSLMGADPESGALVIGDIVRAGQTVQFHVRDAETAREDLLALLEPQAALSTPAGALIFSCNGRGSRMFAVPNHDAAATLGVLPDLPLAGFFAMGELGPVGGRSFIHGHTASIALFRSA